MPPKNVKSMTLYGPQEFFEDVKKAAKLEPNASGGVGVPVVQFIRTLCAEGLRKRFGTGKKPKLPTHLQALRAGLTDDDE